MKFFSNTSFKSLAAAAAVMLFASSAVYAACSTDCATYANAKAEPVRTSVYSQVYYSCINSGGSSWSCSDAARTNSQNAYNQAYSYYYGQCTSGNCV
jgi:hypothetical protein